MSKQPYKTVKDVFEKLDADVVAFINRAGEEIDGFDLPDNMKVVEVRDMGGGAFEVEVAL